MIRAVAGVVIGYLTMALTVFASFSLLYLGLGADRSFKPGSYEVSDVWIWASMALGLVAAIVGGYVCVAIARRRRPASTFAVIVFLLGLGMAIPVLLANRTEARERTGAPSNIEAMTEARQPGWVALLNPLLGAAGILVGSRFRRLPPSA